MSDSRTILIADDDRAIRTVLSQALGRSGYQVRATSSASTLWRWGEGGEGDLVVTDMVMPDENGLDLVPRIRRVRLDVGRLSGLVPEAVRFCFELVAAGTTCEGALVEIEEPCGHARCRTCGRAFETGEVLPLCDCGSADVAVEGGRELRIREVEVV